MDLILEILMLITAVILAIFSAVLAFSCTIYDDETQNFKYTFWLAISLLYIILIITKWTGQ